MGVLAFNDVRETEIHTLQALAPSLIAFETAIAFENFERYKRPGNYQIPAKLIQSDGKRQSSETHKLNNSTAFMISTLAYTLEVVLLSKIKNNKRNYNFVSCLTWV